MINWPKKLRANCELQHNWFQKAKHNTFFNLCNINQPTGSIYVCEDLKTIQNQTISNQVTRITGQGTWWFFLFLAPGCKIHNPDGDYPLENQIKVLSFSAGYFCHTDSRFYDQVGWLLAHVFIKPLESQTVPCSETISTIIDQINQEICKG